MDTDDLTPMAYETISLAYEACQPLRAEIGASAREFRTEDEFLCGVATYVEEILEDPEGYLDSWNLLDEVSVRAFVEKVRRVEAHIAATLNTPRIQRGKPPFEERYFRPPQKTKKRKEAEQARPDNAG